MNNTIRKTRTVSIIRWVARIVGLLYIAFFLLMFIGESLSSSQETNSMTLREGLGFVFVFIFFAGLILAWKWEGIGGFIALGGTIGWTIAIQAYSLITVIIAAPAILFLICWLLSGRRFTIEKAQ